MKNTKIKINDFINIKDNINNGIIPKIKGHVILRDPLTNKIIDERDNLVTLRLRSYILELICGMNTPEGYNNNKNRTVCLFKIGSGGADLKASPLEPIAPKFSDTDLYSPVPFVISSDLKDTLPEYQANPSIIESLNNEQQKMYYLPKEQPDGSIRYYGKVFEKDSNRLKLDKNNGVVYWHGTCRITANEARGFVINELGLILAHYNQNNNTYTDEELATHVTFSSISLTSLKSGLLVDYLLYA